MLLDHTSTTRPAAETVDEEQLRVVISWLNAEYGGRVDAAAIDRIAREEFGSFDRARVREFVPTITWRLARMRLEDEIARHA